MSLREWSAFWKEFRGSFQSTGALCPSSRHLAKAITRRCSNPERPSRWLEAGPGTGPFTDALIRGLGPNDQLVLVELNDRFVALLRDRLERDPAWSAKKSQVTVVHGPVESMTDPAPFHGIVCGLPFNNFEPPMVDQLFQQFLDRLVPGGSFSFFEYWAIRRLAAPFVGSTNRQRQSAIASVIDEHLTRHRDASELVMFNVPPALVHHLVKRT